MAKGFGKQQDGPIGYILVLLPDVGAYAGKFSLDFRGESGPFIGITNMLEEAQVWKTQKLAKQAIEDYYADFILSTLDEQPELSVQIKRLKQSSTGKLQTEWVESIHFHRKN
jgi:hypothetical protein